LFAIACFHNSPTVWFSSTLLRRRSDKDEDVSLLVGQVDEICLSVKEIMSQLNCLSSGAYHCSEIHTRGMKYTNNKNNISEILKVYIINSTCITMSYILNIKTRPLVTEYLLTIKLVGGTNSAHSFNPYAYFGSAGRVCLLENVKFYMSYLQQYTKIIKMLTLKTYFS
jgi:hypothetical protein